jgi:hypothetical protein
MLFRRSSLSLFCRKTMFFRRSSTLPLSSGSVVVENEFRTWTNNNKNNRMGKNIDIGILKVSFQ